jgi:hypothetical protein
MYRFMPTPAKNPASESPAGGSAVMLFRQFSQEGSPSARTTAPNGATIQPLCATFGDRNKSGRLRFFVLPRWRTQMAERETVSLIGSDKVEGTAVYGPDDTKIGSIERVMIDKVSGKVSYAVLSFGGFLGIGDDHYPLPWQSLKYDKAVEGYRTGVTRRQLEGAPKYGNDNSWNWSDPARARAVNDYYGVGLAV